MFLPMSLRKHAAAHRRGRLACLALLAALAAASPLAAADTARVTRYPVVFAHGMAGWDALGGFSYFGNDLGLFVGDSCAVLPVPGCNSWITGAQSARTEAFQVTRLNSSEVRGNELYEHVRSLMATTGAAMVNLVGHSQGGLDIRKAAHRLAARYDGPRVGALISLSSPHRGSPYARQMLERFARTPDGRFCAALPSPGDGSDPCRPARERLARLLFDADHGSTAAGNDVIAAGTQLVFDDYDPGDGKRTGARAFNAVYTAQGVAGYVASVVTGQDDAGMMPLLAALGAVTGFNADGDGYCYGDCDNDGAAGTGDGDVRDMDDDGMVGINSQQMGVRLAYVEEDWRCRWSGCRDPLDGFVEVAATGVVSDLNDPEPVVMTSHEGRLSQDHLDLLSLGPDTFDEDEFYAALMDFIAGKGY